MSKRIGIFSDFHTGHRSGLNPPGFLYGNRELVNKLIDKWKWFEDSIDKQGPFDCAIFLGDIVDGNGVKSANERILNINDQQKAGAQIIERIPAPIKFILSGTEVHVNTKGDGYEVEKGIAEALGIVFKGQIWIEVAVDGPGTKHLQGGDEGYILDCRHHPAGSSQVFPGNPLQREYESNVRWSREGAQPEATHVVRGHTHKSFQLGEPNKWQGIAVPGLQGKTNYGRRLSNTVHIGWGTLDILEGMWPIWTVYQKQWEVEKAFRI